MPYTKSQKDFAMDFLRAVQSHLRQNFKNKVFEWRAMGYIDARALVLNAFTNVEADTVVPDGTTWVVEYLSKFDNDWRMSAENAYDTYAEAQTVAAERESHSANCIGLKYRVTEVPPAKVFDDGTTFVVEYFSKSDNRWCLSANSNVKNPYDTYEAAHTAAKAQEAYSAKYFELKYRVTVVPPAKPEPLLDPYCVGETDPRVHAMVDVIDFVKANALYVGTVVKTVEIDFDGLAAKVLKGRIKDEDVLKLLPFKTDVEAGYTYNHIVNASAYTVETNAHFIHEGGTLCARAGGSFRTHRDAKPNCPGCLAKAKSLIVEHLIATSQLGG